MTSVAPDVTAGPATQVDLLSGLDAVPSRASLAPGLLFPPYQRSPKPGTLRRVVSTACLPGWCRSSTPRDALRFDLREVADLLAAEPRPAAITMLVLMGRLWDGTPFVGEDRVAILGADD